MNFLVWLESTGIARSVGESVAITASLSALHLVGFTFAVGAGLVSNLRATGVLLDPVPLPAITRPALRLVGAGLIVSLVTGLALFAPRASYTAPGGIFQLKMALLLLAAGHQFLFYGLALRRPDSAAVLIRAGGVVGALLWIALAATACAFILLE